MLNGVNIVSWLITIAGLCLFETINSIDNAVINAEVLSTMSKKGRRWFLFWGLLFAVVVVRGLLPWLIVWMATPGLGPIAAFTATFSNDPQVIKAVDAAAPILLAGGGIFLIFLFLHWLFIEPKKYGLKGERFIHSQAIWFFAVVSIILSIIVWFALQRNALMAFGAVVGSTTFFITHGFKQNAEMRELQLLSGKDNLTDLSKLLYLEVLDATFSMDGVLGAFAFTLSVPLILIGNGLGALVLRQMTVGNIERIKKYIYLKNGAMYAIFFLGTVMLLESFGFHVPSWAAPLITFLVIGYFFIRSRRIMTHCPKKREAASGRH